MKVAVDGRDGRVMASQFVHALTSKPPSQIPGFIAFLKKKKNPRNSTPGAHFALLGLMAMGLRVTD